MTRPTSAPRTTAAARARVAGAVLVGAVALLLVPGCERPDPSGTSPGRTPVAWQPQRPEFEAIAERLYRGENEYLGRGLIDKWRLVLRRPDLSPAQRVTGMISLADQLLVFGEIDEAISLTTSALALAEQSGAPAATRAAILRMQGRAYLRQAEVQNCVVRHNRDCCILPLAGGGRHEIAEPARNARASYLAWLEVEPTSVRAAWLLNIVAMAVGEYPDGVPPQHRIPPGAFAARGESPRFTDVAPAVGVATFNLCGGVIADDFDGDGLIDIVTSTFDPRGSLSYFRSLGDGRFEDRSSASRLDDQLGGLNCVGADFDNDGDPDILVLRGAWLKDDGRIRNSLIRNNGDGTFTDVTRDAGMGSARPTQAAAWGDFDNDGDLDLYVVNESRLELDGVSFPAELFRNEGDGRFTEVAAAAGVTNDRYAKGVAAGDFDNDGDLDLYVSNVGKNRLYRNDGDMTFTDVAPTLGVTHPEGRSFASWFFDWNNDGWLDLFVASYQATVENIAADTAGAPHRSPPPRLYRNDGGTFTDVTVEAGLDHAYLPMGANFGDVDNDGWLDMYLATGEPSYDALMPNVLLRNEGGRLFRNATYSAGLGHLQKGHGVAFADFDEDGDQDIYHQLGGFYPGDKFQNALFVNPGVGHRFITIELVGTRTNRQAIGARIRIVIEEDGREREIHRAVGSVSSFGGSPRRQEIGLGNATAIRTLEIAWPTSGTRRSFADVPLDSSVRIVEDGESFELLPRSPFELPAAEATAAAAAGRG